MNPGTRAEGVKSQAGQTARGLCTLEPPSEQCPGLCIVTEAWGHRLMNIYPASKVKRCAEEQVKLDKDTAWKPKVATLRPQTPSLYAETADRPPRRLRELET